MTDAISATLFSIVLLVLLTFLPLIPAIAIYRLFPDTKVSTTGPLSALTLRSSGAFSIYVVVFLVLAPFAYKSYDQIGSITHSSWTISGQLLLKDSDGHDIKNSNLLNSVSVSLSPQYYQLVDGNFTLTVPELNGKVPNLVFGLGDKGSAVVSFTQPTDYQFERDEDHKTIALRTAVPLRITSAKPYNDYRAPLKPLAASVAQNGHP